MVCVLPGIDTLLWLQFPCTFLSLPYSYQNRDKAVMTSKWREAIWQRGKAKEALRVLDRLRIRYSMCLSKTPLEPLSEHSLFSPLLKGHLNKPGFHSLLPFPPLILHLLLSSSFGLSLSSSFSFPSIKLWKFFVAYLFLMISSSFS